MLLVGIKEQHQLVKLLIKVPKLNYSKLKLNESK